MRGRGVFLFLFSPERGRVETMLPVIDLHQDFHRHLKRQWEFPVRNQTSLSQLKEVNVRVLVTTGETERYKPIEPQVIRQIHFYRSQIGWELIHTKDQLKKCLEGESRGFIYHLEGIGALDLTEDSKLVDNLEQLYVRGMRSLSLTHIRDNSFAGGNEGHNELTKRGEVVIDWARSRGVLMDFAHLNEKSFMQAVKVWRQPILVSHGNARSLADTGLHRNLTDEQLRLVAESGGVVGVMFSRNFVKVNRLVKLSDVIDHYLYLVDMVGESGVAIGSDFGGSYHGTPVAGLVRTRDLPSLFHGLHERGLTEGQVEKIAWKNAGEFLLSVIR